MISQKRKEELLKKQVFLFDIDGTLSLGEQMIPGAVELIDVLKQTNRKFYLITNNSTKHRRDYVDFFERHKIEIKAENILTAGSVAKQYCVENLKGKKIFFIGTRALKQELTLAKIDVTEEYDENADCVLAAFDTSLSYEKLWNASRLLANKDVLFIATNPDLCCPTDFGAVPDCGSICQMLTNATGREPKYIGKPYADMVNLCRKLSGVPSEQIAFVGDRLYTDMLCAENAGIDGVLVLSGEASREDAQNCGIQISFVMDSVKDLYELLKSDIK